MPATRIGAIIREHEPRAETADTAIRLARHFGTTPQFWLNQRTTYDLSRAKLAAGPTIERDIHPRAA